MAAPRGDVVEAEASSPKESRTSTVLWILGIVTGLSLISFFIFQADDSSPEVVPSYVEGQTASFKGVVNEISRSGAKEQYVTIETIAGYSIRCYVGGDSQTFREGEVVQATGRISSWLNGGGGSLRSCTATR